MSPVFVVMVTVPDEATARRIAEALLEERLIACANWAGPIRSRYWWEGQQEESQEVVLFLKTTQTHWKALVQRIEALHPYQVPEILALPVAAGNPAYLDWVGAETESRAES